MEETLPHIVCDLKGCRVLYSISAKNQAYGILGSDQNIGTNNNFHQIIAIHIFLILRITPWGFNFKNHISLISMFLSFSL